MLNFFTGDPICPRERMAHLITVPDSASYWPSSALVSGASTSADRFSANLSPHPRNPVTNPLRHTSALTDANDHTQSSPGKILRSIRMNKLSSAGNEAVMFPTYAGWGSCVDTRSHSSKNSEVEDVEESVLRIAWGSTCCPRCFLTLPTESALAGSVSRHGNIERHSYRSIRCACRKCHRNGDQRGEWPNAKRDQRGGWRF